MISVFTFVLFLESSNRFSSQLFILILLFHFFRVGWQHCFRILQESRKSNKIVVIRTYFFEKTGAAFLAAPACLLRNRKSQKHFCAFIDVAASERQDEVPRLGMSEDIFPYFLKGFKPDAARNFDSQIGG